MRVRCERSEGPVWRVYLDPSESGEEVGLDPSGLAALEVVLDEAHAAPQCRVVVLEGGTQVFCRGMDLGYLLRHAEDDHSEGMRAYARCMSKLESLDQVTVCVVAGAALGGGVGLAAACDIVLGTGDASFCLPECVLGLIPAMVLPLLATRMPMHKARWLALTGHTLSVADAERLGLVDLHVESDALEARLRRTLKQLLRTSPSAVARVKRFTSEIDGLPLAEALMLGAEQTARDVRDPNILAGIRALSDGETPEWFDRYDPDPGGPQ